MAKEIDIVDLAVGIFIMALLIPFAMTQFVAVDTTNWSASAKLIWDNIPVFALLGILLYYVKRGKRGR